MVKYFTALISCAALFLSAASARANTLREIQPLSFGAISVTGAAPQTVVIQPNGATPTPSPGILRLHRGGNAVYEITQLPANTPFTTTIPDTTLTSSSGTRTFDITDFMVLPDNTSNPQADASGNATLRIGATLTTRSGTVYTPGAYRGTYNLMINY